MKLYDLVLVPFMNQKWGTCGQVISKPYEERGEQRVMVREIPNDPTTIAEYAVNDLKVITGYKWVHHAIVSGRGDFPVDMLRYDFCRPVNFTLEVNRWGGLTIPTINEEWLKSQPNGSPIDKERLIVARCTELKSPNYGSVFTSDRWNSFGWRIKPLGNPVKITKE